MSPTSEPEEKGSPARSLVLVRHGKSDWSVQASDRDRPLNARGRRQAAETGQWLAAHRFAPDGVVVSPAERALATWTLLAAELGASPRPVVEEQAYSFDGDDLLEVVRRLPRDWHAAALVGHNPALEELVVSLTGERADMPTSALALIEMAGEWSDAGRGDARLRAHGRPPGG